MVTLTCNPTKRWRLWIRGSSHPQLYGEFEVKLGHTKPSLKKICIILSSMHSHTCLVCKPHPAASGHLDISPLTCHIPSALSHCHCGFPVESKSLCKEPDRKDLELHGTGSPSQAPPCSRPTKARQLPVHAFAQRLTYKCCVG